MTKTCIKDNFIRLITLLNFKACHCNRGNYEHIKGFLYFSSCNLSENVHSLKIKRETQGSVFSERLSLKGGMIIDVRLMDLNYVKQKTNTDTCFNNSLSFSSLWLLCLSSFRYQYLHCVWGCITGGLGVPHVQSHWQFPSLALLLLLYNSHLLFGMARQGESQYLPTALFKILSAPTAWQQGIAEHQKVLVNWQNVIFLWKTQRFPLVSGIFSG